MDKQATNFAVSKLSKDEFIKHFSVSKCQKEYREIKTVKEAFLNEISPSLLSIKKIYSEDFVLAYLESWLYNLNDFLNLVRKFNPNQISETAFYLFSDFNFLKLSEINLIFVRIKKGSLGTLYQSIDGTIVYSFFKDYAQERTEYIFRQNDLKEKDNLNINDKASLILRCLKNSPNYSQLIKKINKTDT
ncbi:MAG TPA: hypothetical protein DCG75_04570 [Bacteroidales bacterium]|nr:hypothetical protein [Bacteroidales bacterium]